MENVLLLNASFEPLRVINWQRAVTLLFAGKVEVLKEYNREIRSVSLAIRLPAVIRLLKLARMQPPGVKFSRQNIYARDAYTCQYCGAKPPLHELTYDHVIPRALGGPTDWTNIVTCCLLCNRRKGGKRLEHSGLQLRRFPHKPAWHPHVAISIGLRDLPESWQEYLTWYVHSARE
jgi:5-methylcytosine-specific restriction endonuclease McrA